jgi:recombinational DNA repair protein RecT
MQSGEFAFLEARPVFEKDTFALDYAQQILQHAPHAGEDGPGAIHGAYAVYLDRNGIRHMQFVSGREIKEGSDRMLISGMTAEEVCRKVALCALLAMAPIPLSELRHALDFETRSAAQ